MANPQLLQSSSPTVISPFSKDLVRDEKLTLSNPNFKADLKIAAKLMITESERLKQDPYPSDFLLVNFASAVYDCDKSELKIPDDLELAEGWSLLTTAKNTQWLNKYFGAAFVNYHSQQIVISHRGTDVSKFGCLWADARGVFGNKTVGQMSSAATFADIIRDTLKDLNETIGTNFHISFTGHSLGGWLAQITTFTVEYLEMHSKYFFKSMDKNASFHAHTVTFDTPGCEEMLVKLKRDYYLRYYNPLSLDQLDITSYLSAPNRINTCNHHVGTLYRLETKYELSFLEKHTALYNITTHKMNYNFSSLFSSSGEVITGQLYQIVDWPVNSVFHNREYKEFFKHAKSSNNYHLDSDYKLIESDTGSFYSGLRYQCFNYKPNICSLRIFNEEEIWLLECWLSLRQKGVALNKIEEFCRGKNLEYEKEFFPAFELDLKEGLLVSPDKENLKTTIRICKQLVRWCNDITNTFKAQIADVPTSLEALLHAASANYLIPMNYNDLIFGDYKHQKSLQSFLRSKSKFVLDLVITQKCIDVEPLRIFSILNELTNIEDEFVNKYIKDGHYVFIDWKCILGLYKIIDFEYIFQNYCNINLFIIDCSSHEVIVDSTEKSIFISLLQKMQIMCSTSNKKFIFITSDFYDKELLSDDFSLITDIFCTTLTDEIYLKQKIDNTTFQDLKQESKCRLLDNIIVKFQKNKWALRNILGIQNDEELDVDSILDNVNTLIRPDILNTIVTGNMTIEIDNQIPRLCDSEVCHLRFYKYFTKEEFKAFFDKNVLLHGVLFFVTCTTLTDKNLEYEDHPQVEVVRLQDGREENESFLEYCYRNQDKKVYWFKTDTICFCLEKLYNVDFYIQRKFTNQFKLNFSKKIPPNIEIPDLFIFYNVCDNQKQTLLKDLKVRFGLVEDRNIILLPQEGIESTFDKSSQRSVHWFHVNDQMECVWIKSVGPLDNIRDIIQIDESKIWDEKMINPKECKTLIIADRAGAGKSTTLTNLFGNVMNSWVIRINFKDFENIKRLKLPITVDDVVEFVLPKQADPKYDHFVKQLLKYLLLNKSVISVFILFDGFDEIRGNSEEDTLRLQRNIINLILFLKDNTDAIVWITTRDNRKELLENKLSSFAIKFDMITPTERRDFLKDFWKCLLNCESNNDLLFNDVENRMNIYITELFSRAEQTFGKEIAGFIGIPLQIRMLGEIAMPSVQLFTDADGFQVNIPNNLLDIFGTFVANKYDIYVRQKTKLATGLNDITRRWFSDILTNKHRELAVKKIFFEENEELGHNFGDLLELNAAGLIELNDSNSSFDFIDKNIAYYFIAHKQMTLLKAKNKKYLHGKYALDYHLLTVIFLQSEYRIIRLFLESHFARMLSPIHEMQFYASEIVNLLANDAAISKLCDSRNQTALHVLAYEECFNILKFIIDGIKKDKQHIGDKIIPIFTVRDASHDTAFRIALRSKNWNLIMIFIELLACYEREVQEQLLVATLFVRYGDKESEELKILLEYSERYPGLKDILSEIQEKCQFIEDIHSASVKGNMEKVQDCYHKVGNKTHQKYLLRSTNKDGASPLSAAIKSDREEVISYLISLGSELNVEDAYNMTLIAWAARNGNLKLIQFLVEKGCDCEKPDRNRISPMLHAAKTSHLNVVKYFLERHQYDKTFINYKDRFGNSALFWAAKGNHIKVVQFLIEVGADIETENRQGTRPLHTSIKSHCWGVTKYLLKVGANINVRNGFGNTPLHITIKTGKWDMVQYLIDKNADINIPDQKQKTAKEYLDEAERSYMYKKENEN